MYLLPALFFLSTDEAMSRAAVEKVRMLQGRDRFEMLVGRRELAARYHGYLNRRIKERRVMYVMIDVEADPKKPEGPLNAGKQIRLKIKSGQTAKWLADMVVKKYALHPNHAKTIAATLQVAIDKH